MPGDRIDDVVETECTGFARDLRVKHDLKKQIAELAHEIGEILSLYRIGDLVGFLDRIRCDGVKRLHTIPRTTTLGIAQPRHDAD